MIKEARDSLIGIARYFTWRADASSYFTGTRGAFARSFVACLLTFPFAMVYAYWDTDLPVRPRLDAFGWTVYAIEEIANIAIMLGIALLAARLLGRRDHFFRYGAASNWLLLPGTIIVFAFMAAEEKTGWFAREDAVGIVATGIGSLVGAALLYWGWAVLHQALKLRWWQSLPLVLVMIFVSLIISAIARVAVQIESTPIAN